MRALSWVLSPLASVSALAVSLRDLVETADHGAGELVDAELAGPDLGPPIVVIAAAAQFQYANPQSSPSW